MWEGERERLWFNPLSICWFFWLIDFSDWFWLSKVSNKIKHQQVMIVCCWYGICLVFFRFPNIVHLLYRPRRFFKKIWSRIFLFSDQPTDRIERKLPWANYFYLISLKKFFWNEHTQHNTHVCANSNFDDDMMMMHVWLISAK